jgi:putative nucleotidyltransferase with HDIG domain
MSTVLVVDDPGSPLFGAVPVERPPVAVSAPGDALDRLAREPFEAVVVAIPAQGADGTVARLIEIAAAHPDLLRVVVLDGHGNGALSADVSRLAHRMFDGADASLAVADTVEQVGRLRPLVTDPRLARLIGRLVSVPTAPALYQRLLRECRATNPSIRTIGSLVADDPGLATKLLQLANCALYARGARVVDPVQAVQRVGMAALQCLALSAHVFSGFDEALSRRFDFEGIWRHGLVVNSFAAIIARLERASGDVVDTATTGGLLHDIGRVVLSANLPDDYDEVMRLVETERSLVDAEIKVFGVSHAGVGAYLLALWGLPTDIVEVVARSHDVTVPLASTFEPATGLMAADLVAGEVLGTPAEDTEAQPTFTDGGHGVRWAAWRDACLAWASRSPSDA